MQNLNTLSEKEYECEKVTESGKDSEISQNLNSQGIYVAPTEARSRSATRSAVAEAIKIRRVENQGRVIHLTCYEATP